MATESALYCHIRKNAWKFNQKARNINRKAKKESKIATVPHVNLEVVGGNKGNERENVELIKLQRSLSEKSFKSNSSEKSSSKEKKRIKEEEKEKDCKTSPQGKKNLKNERTLCAKVWFFKTLYKSGNKDSKNTLKTE